MVMVVVMHHKLNNVERHSGRRRVRLHTFEVALAQVIVQALFSGCRLRHADTREMRYVIVRHCMQ